MLRATPALGLWSPLHGLQIVRNGRSLRGDSRVFVKKAFEQNASLFISDEGIVGESSGDHELSAVGGLMSITSNLRLQQAYRGVNDLDFSDWQFEEIGEIFTDKFSRRLNEMLLRQPPVTEAQGKLEMGRLIAETFDAMWGVFLPRQQQALVEIVKFRLELLAGPLQLLEQPACSESLKAQLEPVFSQDRRDLLDIEVRLQKERFELLRQRGHLDGNFTAESRPSYLAPSVIVMEAFLKAAEYRK